MPKISVIMGVYNAETTLKESIDSILVQTYDDWEVVACDDGSSDNSRTILREYADKDKRIKVLANETNKGLNYTLNKCLRYASGVYIARMDADDISLKERFEKQVRILENNKSIAIVSSAMILFDDHGDWGLARSLERPQKKDFVRHNPFFHGPAMVRKEAYEAVGGYSTDKRTFRVEDYHLWIKMYAKGYRGHFIQEPLYKMRDNKATLKRRQLKYRINEAYIIWFAVDELKLNKLFVAYCIKPIVLGILPAGIYNYLHRRRSSYLY